MTSILRRGGGRRGGDRDWMTSASAEQRKLHHCRKCGCRIEPWQTWCRECAEELRELRAMPAETVETVETP